MRVFRAIPSTLVLLTAMLVAGKASAIDVNFIDEPSSRIILEQGNTYSLSEPSLAFEQLPENFRGLPWQKSGNLNFGIVSEAKWLLFGIQVSDQQAGARILEIPNATLRQVELLHWQEATDGSIRRVNAQVSGSGMPFREKPVTSTQVSFALNFTPDTQHWVALRVDTPYTSRIPLVLKDIREYQQDWFYLNLLYGSYLGLVLVMCFASLAIYFAIRDQSFLFYTLFILAVAFWIAIQRGYAHAIFWPFADDWNVRAYVVFLPVAAGTSVLFTREFLAIKANMPRANLLLIGLLSVWCTVALASFFAPISIILSICAPLTIVGGTTLFVCGILSWIKGVKEARYFVIAWVILIMSAVSTMASEMGLVPSDYPIENSLLLGSALEILFMSIGLAWRLNRIWLDKLRAERASAELTLQVQQKEFHEQARINQELETRVEMRTQELANAIIELNEANEKLQQLTLTDPLTNLYNRRFFDTKLLEEWARAGRDQQPLALVLIDIDHFKSINDQHGHDVGDKCLQLVAQTLSEVISRKSDILIRFGGEEFAVLAPNTDTNGAMVLAERLRRALDESTLTLPNMALHLTISLGINVSVPDGQKTLRSFFREADEALYNAKAQGRNRAVLNSNEDQTRPKR